MTPGTIYLVGAGPGDPDLMTVRARRVLECADVVMHDHVVSDEMLNLAVGSLRIDAGLGGFGNNAYQRELARKLVELADADKVVCRLKSGDPFIFGNGGETLAALRAECAAQGKDLRIEIVPGISSGIAASAQLGLPLTHTGLPPSLGLLSGHREPGLPGHDYAALAKLGTLVFYMALGTIGEHTQGLIAAGLDPVTPVCIIERGSHAAQRVVTAQLGTLEQAVIRNAIVEPAVFVIGKTAGLINPA